MIVVNAFIKKTVNWNGCTVWHRPNQGGTEGTYPPHFQKTWWFCA